MAGGLLLFHGEETMNRVLLSVITPTYNRGELLKNCFSSLRAQTDDRFEWIIVDDGSTDDTAQIVSGFCNSAPQMHIVYVQKENGGKHTALNAAHPHIRGKYVLILDSDDTLTDDAVAVVLECWSRWENHSEVGIVTLLKGKDREHPNCYGAQENVPVDIMSGKRIRPVSNDACEVIRTEVFLQYPFPVFPGETFLSEGALWNRVSFTHKCVYVNRVIYLCDYLAGGLTQSGRAMRIRSPRGGMYTHNLNMSGKSGCKRRVKSGMLYTCYGFFAGQSPLQMHRACDHKWLMWMCLPFGWLLYLFWKKSF